MIDPFQFSVWYLMSIAISIFWNILEAMVATWKAEQLPLLITLKSSKSAAPWDRLSVLYEIFHESDFKVVGNSINILRISPLLWILYLLGSGSTQHFYCSIPLTLEIVLANIQQKQSSRDGPLQQKTP